MASGTAPVKEDADTRSQSVGESERFIEAQLTKTGTHIRLTDVFEGLLTLGAVCLGYFLFGALLDHWIIPGGLHGIGRALLFVTLIAGGSYYTWIRLVPHLVRRINPVYAAHTIELSEPSLKNSIVNFLLLRSSSAQLPVDANVYQAVEHQAARELKRAAVDTAVDRSRLIKIGYLFAALLAIAGLYKVVSPKDPFITLRRIVFPWADILPPTKVVIADIEPGSTTVFRGQNVSVSALVHGTWSGEDVLVVYTTDDAQAVDRSVHMHVPAGEYRHAATLPDAEGGVQQGFRYRLEAGDFVSRTYQVSVLSAPTIVVQSVTYDYPSYTGLLQQKVEREGDIRGIEGTTVTIDALANQPIKTAGIDFDCDGSIDENMTVQGDVARGTFPLALQEDRKTPRHESYLVRFTTMSGHQNVQPVRYHIEVLPDLSPEIELLAPKDGLDLPLNGSATVELEAHDRDFALRLVKLTAKLASDREGKSVVDKLLVDPDRDGLQRGQTVRKFPLQPSRLGLKAGDVIEYWAEAEDNKEPDPNRTQTLHRRIRIVSPDTNWQKTPDQLAQADNPADPNDRQDRSRNDRDKPRQPPTKKNQNPDQQRRPDSRDGQPSDPKEQSTGKGDQDKHDSQQADDGKGGRDQKQTGEQPAGQQKSEKQGSKDKKGDSSKSESGQNGEGDQQGEGASNGQSGDSSGRTAPQPHDGGGSDKQKPDESSNPSQREKVPNDGTADGDAIERILEHRQKNEDKPDGSGQQADKQSQPEGDRQPNIKEQSPTKQADKQSDNSRDGHQEESGAGKDQTGKQSSGKGETGDKGTAGQGQEKDSTTAQPGGTGEAEKKSSSRAQDKGSLDQGGQKGSDQPNAGQPQSDKNSKQPSSTNSGADKHQAQDKSPGGENSNAAPEKGRDANANDKAKRVRGEKQEGNPGGDQPSPGQGDGANPSTQDKTKQKPPTDEPNPDGRGGGQDNPGESGAGKRNAGKENTSPAGQLEPNQSSKKNDSTNQADRQERPGQEPNSPSTSKHESNSQGEQGGDRSGGGEQGGGQKANKPGTGGSGQNTAAEEGSGKSEQPGTGEASSRPGRDQQSDKPTGESGQQKSPGSSSRPMQPGGQAQPKAGNSNQHPEASKGGQQPPSGQNQPGTTDSGQSAGGAQGDPGGGGQPNNKSNPQPAAAHETGAEDPNLEYARKATDLAIEHLKNQLKNGQADPELLDQLGWNEEDVKNFVARWEKMRREADSAPAKSAVPRRELDSALRSLGLKPRGADLKSDSARDDQLHGLRESRRSSPPAEYAEQYKAYTQGTSRGIERQPPTKANPAK